MKALRWYSGPSATATILIPALPCERDPSHSLSVVGESEYGAVKFQGKFFMLTMAGPFQVGQAGAGKLLSSWLAIVMPSLIELPLAPGPEAQRHHLPLSNDTRFLNYPQIWNFRCWYNIPLTKIRPFFVLWILLCAVPSNVIFFFSFATPPCQWPLIQAYRKYPPTTSPVNDNQLEAIFGHYYSTTINCRYVL